jgi:hypothetical protein
MRIFPARSGPCSGNRPSLDLASLAVDTQFSDELERLEETYATSSEFVERANHLLLLARRPQAAAKSESEPNFGTDTLCGVRSTTEKSTP